MTVVSPVKPDLQSDQLPGSGRRAGSWVKLILSILVWQAIAICFAEAVLLWGGLGEEEIFNFDRQLGFMHFPNKRVTWRSEGYSHSYFNADGMRDPGLTVDKPAGAYRVAVLGDSMIESLQVPVERSFGQILQRQLTEKLHRPVQVINFGNSGYSTTQEYLLLDRKVFAYKPDLVILGYSSRDMFENWAPPDQTITNVRPVAIDLPGGHLVIDSSPVENWLKTPRAQFLQRIGWLRQNSRIWGLVSATETQLSFHDPVYRFLNALFTKPGKTLKEIGQNLKSPGQIMKWATPSFDIRFFDNSTAHDTEMTQSSITRAPQKIPEGVNRLQTVAQLHPVAASAAAPSASVSTPAAASGSVLPVVKKGANSNYINLMQRTMGSLLSGMQDKCAQHGARFAVLITPSVVGLIPNSGAEEQFFGVGYDDEISIIEKLCEQSRIPLVNAEAAAAQLSVPQRAQLFYAMHLRPEGHDLLVRVLLPFLSSNIDSAAKK